MSGRIASKRTQEGHGKGLGSNSMVGGTPDISGFFTERAHHSLAAQEWRKFVKSNPDKAFVNYMLKRPTTKKIGVHLQDWLTMAKDYPESIHLEKARQQVNEWIERNRAALK